jgi:hypothetical protein
MRIKKNIATSGEGFIFNPGTGDSFTTNPIGADIIFLLKDEKPLEVIIDTICAKYDVDENQFEKDLDDYLSQLKDFTILE